MKRSLFAIVFGWYLYSAWSSNSYHSIFDRASVNKSAPLIQSIPSLKTIKGPSNKPNSALLAETSAASGDKTLAKPAKQFSNGRWGVVDEEGNDLTGDQFDELFDFTEDGLALARMGDKYGHVDRQGRWVVPPAYESAFSFNKGVAPVQEGDKWGYADSTGRIIVPPQFDKVYQFFEDIVIFEAGGRMGYLHRSGEIILPAVAEYVRWYKEGKGAVKIDGMYGYLDNQGSWVIPPRFERANDFKSGIALVYNDGRAYYVDERGEYVKDGDWIDE